MYHKTPRRRTLQVAMTGCLSVITLLLIVPASVHAEDGADGQEACYDETAQITEEEKRIDLSLTDPRGTNGIQYAEPLGHIFVKLGGFSPLVERFERELCLRPNATSAKNLVQKTAAELWQTAVDRAQGRRPDLVNVHPDVVCAGWRVGTTPSTSYPCALDEYDERPLYWTRLMMTRAVRQWTPKQGITDAERASLLKSLEYNSRGITTTDYPQNGDDIRVLTSGFDPYGFASQREVTTTKPGGNASGAVSLQLDGRRFKTPKGDVVVQSVVFPVLWKPFEEGIVEDTFGPHLLRDSKERIDLFMTISLSGFKVERWAGRSAHGGDNNLDFAPGVNGHAPQWPQTIGDDRNLIETTLPYLAMQEADKGTPRVEFDEGNYGEAQPDEPVDGTGGGFLSNASMYHAVRLRDALGAQDIPGGHMHINSSGGGIPAPVGNLRPLTSEEAAADYREGIDQIVAIVEAAGRAEREPVQIALGDSWAYGAPRTGFFGNTDPPPSTGYVAKLRQLLETQSNSSIQLVNTGKTGSTVATLIDGINSRQLPYVEAVLANHHGDNDSSNDVKAITIHTGYPRVPAYQAPFLSVELCELLGIDVSICIEAENAAKRALQEHFDALSEDDWADERENLRELLIRLKNAAPDTPIVLGTYDNALATCNWPEIDPLAVQRGQDALEGGGDFSRGINDVIREVAADFDVPVAEISGQMQADDWVGDSDPSRSDCFHPSESGHAKISEAFAAALGLND